MTDQRFEVQHRAGESRDVLIDHEADPADPTSTWSSPRRSTCAP